MFTPPLRKITPGLWHFVVLAVDWQSDSTGSFKFWLDDELKVNGVNIPTTFDVDNRFLEMRLGIYSSGWFHPRDQKPHESHWYRKIAVGHQVQKIIWHDSITIGGKSYAEVDPKLF